jgi:hypothetical protein
MATQTGRCLCGAVQYAADGVEAHYHACHCSMCRRWTGGPFLVAAAQSVSFQDTTHLGRYRSSDWAERGFCTKCGASLYYLLADAGQYLVAAGTLDNAEELSLGREIFVDCKMRGYEFAGDHERWTEAQTIAFFTGAAN